MSNPQNNVVSKFFKNAIAAGQKQKTENKAETDTAKTLTHEQADKIIPDKEKESSPSETSSWEPAGERDAPLPFNVDTKKQPLTPEQIKRANAVLSFLKNTVAYFKNGNNIVTDAKEFARAVGEILKGGGIVATARRTANSISEAQKAIAYLVNKPLTNTKLGITGTISKNSLEKLGTLKDGEDARLHALAVANIDMLFESAQFDVTHPDEKRRREVQKVHRLGSLMLDPKTGEYVPVMTTVIEYNKDGNRVYSVEAVDIETIKPAGQLVAGEQSSAQQTPIADFNTKIAKLLDDAKRNGCI